MVETHFYHKVELASFITGAALLVLGHLAWIREGETPDDAATLGLWVGSLLAAVPMGAGLIAYRSHGVASHEVGWMWFHEIMAVVVALILVGGGISCRIRSTTIVGSVLTTIYLVSGLLLVQWPSQLQSASLVMMIGGGMFFLTAVLLSIYRDRVIGWHTDLRNKEGVFRVLRWR